MIYGFRKKNKKPPRRVVRRSSFLFYGSVADFIQAVQDGQADLVVGGALRDEDGAVAGTGSDVHFIGILFHVFTSPIVQIAILFPILGI